MTDKALVPVRAGQDEITTPGPDDPYRDFLVGQLSPRTRRIYQSDLLCFFVWLEDPEALEDPQALQEAKAGYRPEPARACRRVARVTTDDIIAYRNHLFDLGRSPSTVARHLSVLRQFFDLAEERGLIPANPARSRRVRSPKVNPYGKAQYLTREQAEALLKLPDRTTVKGRRDYAILLLFLHNALRRSEVVSLRWGDLETVGGHRVAYVLRKGKQEREPVKLKPQVWRAILDHTWRAVVVPWRRRHPSSWPPPTPATTRASTTTASLLTTRRPSPPRLALSSPKSYPRVGKSRAGAREPAIPPCLANHSTWSSPPARSRPAPTPRPGRRRPPTDHSRTSAGGREATTHPCPPARTPRMANIAYGANRSQYLTSHPTT